MMTFLLVAILAVVFQSALKAARRRIDRLEAQLGRQTEIAAALERATDRIRTLETIVEAKPIFDRAPAPADERQEHPEAGVDTVEDRTRSHASLRPSSEIAAPTHPQHAPPPVVPPASPSGSVPDAAQAASPSASFGTDSAVAAPQPRPIIPADEPPAAGPAPIAQPEAATPHAPRPAASPEAWEVVVGTSWLNKIGVLIFVTGLALLLGYSAAHVGPFGRVVMGYVLGAALLGTGVALERRPGFRSYGLGLIAGGWATAYVTTFAMRAIPAARVIDNDAVGFAALLTVAGAMVVHSVRFRSETVTSLAYAAAYLPIAITPLTGYSLAASVPLVASMLFVAHRFGWSTMSVLGLVSTYGILVLRGRVLPGPLLDMSSAGPLAVIWSYWLLFEIADIARLSRVSTAVRRVPLMAANAVGYLGALVSLSSVDAPHELAAILAVTAIAYLLSAVVRSRMATVPVSIEETPAFSTVHGAVAFSAALSASAIALRVSGPWETIFFLVETELLLAAGISLSDRHIRRIGAAMAALTSASAVLLALLPAAEVDVVGLTVAKWTPALGLVAVLWYVNREWLRRRTGDLDVAEELYGWTGLALIALIVGREVEQPYQGSVGLGLALVLSEVGRRGRNDYAWQSRGALGVSVLSVLAVFLGATTSDADVWFSLAPAALMAYVYAWRHPRLTVSYADPGRVAAGVAAVAGGIFVTILQWRVVPEPWLAPAWSAQAIVLTFIARRNSSAMQRWQAYAVTLLSLGFASQWAAAEFGRAFRQDVQPSVFVLVSTAGISVAAFVVSWLGRSRPIGTLKSTDTTVQLESLVLLAIPAVTTYFMVTVEALWFNASTRPFAITITAAAMLAAGFAVRARHLRVLSYVVWFVAAVTALWALMAVPTGEHITWVSLSIAFFLGASVVTREPLRKTRSDSTPTPWYGIEDIVRACLAVAGAFLAAVLLAAEARPSLVTMSWGLEGVVLLSAGFAFRERVLRLLGLGLLFLCILKLFLYDLRELEALARILSFVALGLVLLAVSWTYTRYKEEIKRLL